MDVIETIKQQIADNNVLLYMKGSPNAPQCGFSQRTAQAVMSCGQRFAYVDVLANPEIRANLPQYANWPTFPQLWVKGELIGGCDIVTEMFEKGELQPLIEAAVASDSSVWFMLLLGQLPVTGAAHFFWSGTKFSCFLPFYSVLNA